MSWPRDSFHPAATGVDRRGSVAALLAGLPRESKSQRSLTLRLDYRESWGPRDAPPLQSCGTREFGEEEARPASPTREVSCFARFSLGFSSLASSPCPILARGSGDFPSLLGKAVPAPGAATKPLRPQQLSQNPSPEREARLGTPTGSTELVASGRTELTVPQLGCLLA